MTGLADEIARALAYNRPVKYFRSNDTTTEWGVWNATVLEIADVLDSYDQLHPDTVATFIKDAGGSLPE